MLYRIVRPIFRTYLCLLYCIERILNLPIIRHASDYDFYKATMWQVAYKGEVKLKKQTIRLRDVVVTYKNQNRAKQSMPLATLIPEKALRKQLDHLLTLRFTEKEVDYLRSTGLFDEDALEGLLEYRLMGYQLRVVDNDYEIELSGTWPETMPAETWIMGIKSELAGWYQIRKLGLNPFAVWAEADRRLTEKIKKIRQNLNFRFAEFGSRRRFARLLHYYELWRFKHELPEHKVTTSNVYFAMSLGIFVTGTFAHEILMVLAGLLDIFNMDLRLVHNMGLDLWRSFYEGKTLYGRSILIALTETFGTDAFLEDISQENLEAFDFRQDSGDPTELAYKAIDKWTENGIDPNTKRVVFSDGLNIDKALGLHQEFWDQVIDLYGIGTDLLFDVGFGIRALNYVIKAVHIAIMIDGVIFDAGLVKLSDSPGKFLGEFLDVVRYLKAFNYPKKGLPQRYLEALAA